MNENRAAIKARMIVKRGGPRAARCDWPGCTERGTEVHELINRGRTMGNSQTEARKASYAEELCSLLCRSHHQQAHNPQARETLLKRNIDRYGYPRVKNSWDEVIQRAGSSLGLHFPIQEDDENQTSGE